MKNQLLPNIFKKIGLALYVLAGIPSMIKGWVSVGSDCCDGMADTSNYPISDELYFYTTTISLIGIIIYALSKEKMEDEYTKLLRWESVSTSFICTVVLVLIGMLSIGRDEIFGSALLIELQILFFLIIFYLKKRFALD